MKRKSFLLAISIFSLLVNLHAQDVAGEVDSSQEEAVSLEAAADSENAEETPGEKKQKKTRVKKERAPKKTRASKKASELDETSEANENAESGDLSEDAPLATGQEEMKAEIVIDSSQEDAILFEAAAESEGEETPGEKKKSRGESQDAPEHWPTIEELTADQYHFGILQDWGLSASSVTRIQKKTDVSNFVWTDKMIGVFYEAKSHDFIRLGEASELNFMARMAIYYPYNYTFRDVPQIANQIILYAFDWFVAPSLSINFRERIFFDTQLGLHILYQLHDMWEYLNLGVGLKLNVEFPISSRWTAIAGGMFSFDNGNFGSNRDMRPFDYVWEYQIQFGARYCKKYLNRRSYIKYKPRPLKTKKVRKILPWSEETDLELEYGMPEEDVVEIETAVENLPSAQYLPTD
ncbi:MAG: hypothetical protein NC548_58930 [Lachnospiraceae bacterium]|nr:hypothetical protein [Lachnospiraceae bacterium]